MTQDYDTADLILRLFTVEKSVHMSLFRVQSSPILYAVPYALPLGIYDLATRSPAYVVGLTPVTRSHVARDGHAEANAMPCHAAPSRARGIDKATAHPPAACPVALGCLFPSLWAVGCGLCAVAGGIRSGRLAVSVCDETFRRALAPGLLAGNSLPAPYRDLPRMYSYPGRTGWWVY